LVAVVLAGRLQREVTVTECGFIDCAPPDEDPYDGLRCSGTLESTGAIPGRGRRLLSQVSGRSMLQI
ncbi:MAG: hypothetical protein ACRDTG_11030, partial [Pseudonocardiaceae bacterium]